MHFKKRIVLMYRYNIVSFSIKKISKPINTLKSDMKLRNRKRKHRKQIRKNAKRLSADTNNTKSKFIIHSIKQIDKSYNSEINIILQI